MPDPLPSDIVARLRSDSTAALAASLIPAGSFPDIVRGPYVRSARAATTKAGKRRNLGPPASRTKLCSR